MKQNNMTNKQKEFVKYVRSECKKHGIKCDLRRGAYVKLSGNIKCSGFFDSYNKRLVVGMKNELAFDILVHEFCHLTQWVEQCEPWVNLGNSLDMVDKWLSGEEVDNIGLHMARARDMELDNEKRSVKMLKKFGFDDMVYDYTKRANAYIQFYNYMLHSRRWSKPGNSPYKNERIIEAMSPKFNMKYGELTPKLKKIFEEEGI